MLLILKIYISFFFPIRIVKIEILFVQFCYIVLTLQTELLILAHESYTASCDMEGISNILRAARILTIHLQTAGEHQLMVGNVKFV